jgi:hypothetical protein
MIFQYEYTNKNKTAHVFKRQREYDFIVMCYNNDQESQGGPFASESQAETYAKNFIESTEQPTVTRGCCD